MSRIRTTRPAFFGSPFQGESATVPVGTEFTVLRDGIVEGSVMVLVERDQGGSREGVLYPSEFEFIEEDA